MNNKEQIKKLRDNAELLGLVMFILIFKKVEEFY